MDEIRDEEAEVRTEHKHKPNIGDQMSRLGAWLIVLTFCVAVSGVIFYMLCVNHVDVNEMAGWYDASNGAMWTDNHPGWYITKPWPVVREITIDLRNRKVGFVCEARLINQKLVRFRQEGWREYVKLQGFSPPTDSILLGYAYSGKQYPFLDILEEPDKKDGPDQK